ncbi:Glycosyltransferase involved in cell wall bisynthesis [Quadrisphaera granulorum]|uniref:Glycosyltransferase involved in cell wall biosynthesis n=1 Tax=Quadrisphaera granulorum TaxID=317664 RepID=A0A316ADA1_9ACTN|nr:glycosyltransferase [Quadrisphaera granulorum]PWJ55735.1 glycosyltransferase involved in cell wall biosynthesis [Quadrisphaera granulorum]SZE95232.1 Glycosyltransferase involved in cell wall bisynthesis [Quadrisphaera granulorum]
MAEEQLHVLHVTKRMPSATGGDAVVVSELRRAQHAAGMTTSVLTSRCRDIDDAPGLHRTGLPLQQHQIDVISLRRIVSLLLTAVHAWFLVRRTRPDVVHVHTVDLGAAIAPACLLLGVPRVITLHGTSIGNAYFSPAKQRLEALLLRLGGYAEIMTVDPTTLPALREAGATAAKAVLNAVPLDQPSRLDAEAAAPGGEAAPLLFVGRLERVKGVDVLLDALALLAAGGRRPRLDVVGEGSEREALVAQAARLGIAEQVRFLGRLDQPAVAELRRSASALVLPSRYEGLALVLLEAWASELPVVTSDAGAVPEVCRDGVDALVVPVDDAAALAGALERHLDDPAAAAQRARTARRTAQERHSYPALATALEDIYADARAASGSSALVVNSLAQVLATAAMAASGALFWFLCARLYPAHDVGLATALISASSVVSLASLAGFHTTFLRYLPGSAHRSRYLDTGFLVSAVTGVVLSIGLVLVLPEVAPELSRLRTDWTAAAAFVLVTVATSVNTLTDAAFMALRAAKYNLLFDGVLQSAGRLLGVALLASGGYLGIFSASGAGTLLATAASVVVLVRRFAYRPRGRIDISVLTHVRAYAAGNHLAFVVNLVPTLAIPVLALHQLGATQAAHLSMAFTVSNVFFGAAYAITAATFAEASYAEQPLAQVLRRSARVLAVVVVPATLIMVVFAGPLLSVFGPGYADGASTALVVFGLSTPLVAAYDLATVVLRSRQRSLPHVVVQSVYCVTVVGCIVAWRGAGPVGTAAAWATGTAVGLVAALIAVARTPRAEVPDTNNTPDTTNTADSTASTDGADSRIPATPPPSVSVVQGAP